MYTLIVLAVGFLTGWLARKYKESLTAKITSAENEVKDIVTKVEDKLK